MVTWLKRDMGRRIYYGVAGNQKRYFALKLPLAVDPETSGTTTTAVKIRCFIFILLLWAGEPARLK